jgi:dipeptidyl aminopeptidase/acylaminoacyl peptidase
MTSEPADRPAPAAATAFHDLEAYLALPRISGLTLSPDGTRLVTSVATLDPKSTRYVTALWQLDPGGDRAARRLTRSAKGESGAAFLPDGSLLFTSARPDPAAEAKDEEPRAALWLLPADGGEARVVATRPGGIGGVVVARSSGTIAVASATLPNSVSAEDDAERRSRRTERKVAAILHESYPVRYWDHDLGPDWPRLLVGQPPEPVLPAAPDAAGVEVEPRVELRDLTGHIGPALEDEAGWDLTPDGRSLVVTWKVPEAGGSGRTTLVVIDVATGERRSLLADAEHEYHAPSVSPGGTHVSLTRFRRSSATEPPQATLVIADLASGACWQAAPGWEGWPGKGAWLPDGTAVLVSADENGRSPVFRVDLSARTVSRLTGDDGAYTELQVAPDGSAVYALRAAVGSAPAPVRLDPAAVDQRPVYLPGPAPAADLPGTVTEVTTTAEDGSALRAWLVLPEGASASAPAPLLLWIHGGPLSSWNAWSWRWNPWLMAARGYAVLLPDPALSTGYGQDFIRRGWGSWGAAPFTDLMAITDATIKRPEIDETRTAAMGGSFGGYMANWVAGHTDRFAAIVTHASLWALDQFGPTTDAYYYWRREMTAEMALANSPHRFLRQVRTPMLVVHGDRDYRVPIGEALRLWAELAERSGAADGSMPHKFLYYPDEGHWVLQPQHAVVWYSTVLAFLDHHLLGQEWRTPDLLT